MKHSQWNACLGMTVTCALLWGAAPASAQIVNVLPMASGGPGFNGSVNGAVDWRSGNVDSLRTAGDLMLSLREDRHLTFVVVKGEMGVKSDALYLAKAFEHLRYRVGIGGRWSGEFYAQHGYDKFQRLKFRVLSGAGLRFDVAEWEGGQVAIGTSYMPEFEELNAEVSTGGPQFFHRWSNYLSFGFGLGKEFSFSSTTYIQPRFDAFDDYRLSNESGFSIALGDVLVSPFSFALAYDSRPPKTVENTDMTIRSTLGLRF